VKVGGVDGCPRGWLAAVVDVGARQVTASWRLLPDARAVVALLDGEGLDAVAVDVPIGLPDVGPRQADVLARRLLGSRACCVYPAPPREVVAETDFWQANAVSRQLTGKGLSKQAFFIADRIADFDQVVTPALQARLVECHPEVSFAQLAGTVLPSKKTAAGLAARQQVLAAALPGVESLLDEVPRPATAADARDALACAWSAARWLRGTALRLPAQPALDSRGLRMEIVA
jgi:predicted RNase H-like nuclease